MSASENIVVIGGGHAAAQLCAGLAEAGLGPRVHLVCAESRLPYQRPPLSKIFLKNAAEDLQFLRPADWYRQAGIALHSADPAVSVDRAQRRVTLRSGATLNYAHLVLATGAVPRPIAGLRDDLSNVALLRSADDAYALRRQLSPAQHVTVLGGGFIGLEIAATARALGKGVRLLELAPRLLARSVSPELAAHVLDVHRSSGIDVELGVACEAFEIEADRLTGLSIDGRREPVELLIAGVGALPDCALAVDCGLACDNGIVVDARMRTADPAIYAIGDCANFPEYGSGRRLRLESVQNANDQARTAVAALLGRDEPYRAVPWFWSEQGGMRLQMAGLMPSEASRHRRPGNGPASFSILHYRGEELICVESVNAPMDHMAARKLLESGRSPPAEAACAAGKPLKDFV